ncbi:MAG: hypothetical protein ABIV06_13855, partial [Thermoanaerobaculia bacterium]
SSQGRGSGMNRLEQERAAARWVRTVLAPDFESVDAAVPAPRAQRSAITAAVAKVGEPPPENWQAVWVALELPPAPVLQEGFARRTARLFKAERERSDAPLLTAGWMRAAAAAALLAGIALGSSLAPGTDAFETTASVPDSWTTTSLSEEYLAALSTPETTLESASETPVGVDSPATRP